MIVITDENVASALMIAKTLRAEWAKVEEKVKTIRGLLPHKANTTGPAADELQKLIDRNLEELNEEIQEVRVSIAQFDLAMTNVEGFTEDTVAQVDLSIFDLPADSSPPAPASSDAPAEATA